MIDRLDAELISLLREDGRMSVLELSKRLGIGRATVRQRMDRLEKSGVIRKYTVDLDEGKVGESYAAIVLIAFMPGFVSQREVARRIAGLRGVSELHLISGPWDMIAKIQASSVEEIGRIVIDQLRSIEGVSRTETCSIFSSVKER